MLLAAIGALWVVSIICILFLAAYSYRLTKRNLVAKTTYFWTVTRVLVSLCFSLSIFYFGVAQNVESLPKLLAFQLHSGPIALWTVGAWLTLSLIVALLGTLIGLMDTMWNDWQILERPRVRWLNVDFPRLTMKVPYALTTSAAYPQALLESDLSPNEGAGDNMWALANVLLGLFTGCFLFVGLQGLSQLSFVQALDDFNREYTFGVRVTERVWPTATPDTVSEIQSALLLSQNHDAQETNSRDEIDGQVSQTARTTIALQPITTSDSSQSEQTEAVDLNDRPQAKIESVGDESVDVAPTQIPPAPTSTSVLITEVYGVNARTGPGLTFEVITVLENGTTFPLLGWTDDEQWINVQLPTTSDAWVASWVVDVVQE